MATTLFLLLLATSCVYALLRGGAPERIGALVLLSGVVASAITLSISADRYARTEVLTMWVDVAMAGAFTVLALRAQRYWPIWTAAVHVDLVATHLVMFAPQTESWSYWAMQALWSYPAPVLVAVGTYRHRRRIRLYGTDPAWTARGG